MSTKKKRMCFWGIVVLTVICVALSAFIVLAVSLDNKHFTVKTNYGDTFTIIWSGGKSTIISENSELNYTMRGEIDKDDFCGLCNLPSLRVYKVDYIAIFDDGNGFEVFDKKTDKRAHSEVAAVIKENLQYDPRFYDHNKEFF